MAKQIKVTCKSPSNIALVKYWGKFAVQIPANPSISFCLSNCHTETSIELIDSNTITDTERRAKGFELHFEGKLKPEFDTKIEQFLNRVQDHIPLSREFFIKISSNNSFPHSSGIASSASSMSALAGALGETERVLNNGEKDEMYFQNISNMARLGSGSAARSVSGGYSLWGKYKARTDSSNKFAIKIDDISPYFMSIQDTILLVDKGVKKVSSTIGHSLMDEHPFAIKRFEQANQNLTTLLEILKTEDFHAFANIVELEALTLHALMMSSDPSFILMRPNTLSIIEKIQAKRKSGELDICFTLDAGANVHVLYPKGIVNKAMEFIEKELLDYCENGAYICDEIGSGQVVNTEIYA